jgi:hypothetical protein
VAFFGVCPETVELDVLLVTLVCYTIGVEFTTGLLIVEFIG